MAAASYWTLMASTHFFRVISSEARNAVIFARIWLQEICLPLECRGTHSCASEFSRATMRTWGSASCFSRAAVLTEPHSRRRRRQVQAVSCRGGVSSDSDCGGRDNEGGGIHRGGTGGEAAAFVRGRADWDTAATRKSDCKERNRLNNLRELVCTYILELFGSRRKRTKQALPELLTASEEQ